MRIRKGDNSMANYLMKYKGKYRLKLDVNEVTNDFPRSEDGSIEDIDMYISCQNNNKIFNYGHGVLIAYIPSIIRGHNIIKAVEEQGIEYLDYMETDEEVEFKFKASDIEPIAELMKARTSGANISPFSSKNLPKAKVFIPTDKIERYKDITSVVPKTDLLVIHRLTTSFLNNILQKKLRKGNKKFEYQSDMKKLMLSRQVKEYIFVKNMFDEYLDYLQKELEKIYK